MKKRIDVILTHAASILILCLAAFACADRVLACECKKNNSVEQEFNESKAVFAGEVVSIDGSTSIAFVTFKVEKTWKGEKSETITVRTDNRGKGCGYIFQKGERYLVYASEIERELWTSVCSRTQETRSAVKDINELDGRWKISISRVPPALSVIAVTVKSTGCNFSVDSASPTTLEIEGTPEDNVARMYCEQGDLSMWYLPKEFDSLRDDALIKIIGSDGKPVFVGSLDKKLLAPMSAEMKQANIRQAFKNSMAVFVGKVVEIDESEDDNLITFKVEKVWKGAKAETILLRTDNHPRGDGYAFTKGEKYLVYAEGDNGNLRTSIFTRTAILSTADDDVQWLDGTLKSEANFR